MKDLKELKEFVQNHHVTNSNTVPPLSISYNGIKYFHYTVEDLIKKIQKVTNIK